MFMKNIRDYTYYDFLSRDAKKDANKPFLISDSEVITFGQAKSIVDSLAYQLYSFGVRKGHIVALSAYRDMRIALIKQALIFSGVITFLVDYHKAPEDVIKESTADVQVDFTIFSENGKWVISADHRSSILSVDSAIFFDDSLISSLMEKNNALDPALLIFTSGSSGERKAVLLNQQNFLTNFSMPESDFLEESTDLSISVLPMHHIFSLAIVVNAVTCFHAVYFPSFINQEYVLRRASEMKVTVFYGVPTYYMALTVAKEKITSDLSSVRSGVIAAGPCSYEQLCHIEDTLGFPLTPVYGMSEAFGISTIRYNETKSKRLGGVGRIGNYDQVKILSSQGKELGISEEGEIVVKGMTLMIGYYYGQGNIHSKRDENGFFHTGDMGFIDEEGILHITGRIKDLIIKGGENISSRKIELEFLKLPYIYSAAVVGVHDDYYGEVPCAVVTLKAGYNITAADMRLDISARIQKNEVPKEIRILNQIPLLSTGKVDKQTIKKLFEE